MRLYEANCYKCNKWEKIEGNDQIDRIFVFIKTCVYAKQIPRRVVCHGIGAIYMYVTTIFKHFSNKPVGLSNFICASYLSSEPEV